MYQPRQKKRLQVDDVLLNSIESDANLLIRDQSERSALGLEIAAGVLRIVANHVRDDNDARDDEFSD